MSTDTYVLLFFYWWPYTSYRKVNKKRKKESNKGYDFFTTCSSYYLFLVRKLKNMKKEINYYISEKFIKSDYLSIKNETDIRRLCKVTIDDKLFKLLLLLPNEVKEVKISPQFKNKVKVIDITE